MDGLPVTIRLIDPPLHEFLPNHTELAVQVALEDSLNQRSERHHTLLDAVARLVEQNPMLGLRGVRLGIVVPGPGRHAGPCRARGRRRPHRGRW